MANAMTAERALKQIGAHAEKIKNDEHQQVGEMSPGDTWAQGDVGIVRLEKIPDGCKPMENPSSQLSPGTTQGSRHCLESLEGLRLFVLADPTPLDGPVIDAPQGMRVNHPEHGDVSFGPGVYGVIYQRQYAEELRRVQD